MSFVKAVFFPILKNALVVSHPVKACTAERHLSTLLSSFLAISWIGMYLSWVMTVPEWSACMKTSSAKNTATWRSRSLVLQLCKAAPFLWLDRQRKAVYFWLYALSQLVPVPSSSSSWRLLSSAWLGSGAPLSRDLEEALYKFRMIELKNHCFNSRAEWLKHLCHHSAKEFDCVNVTDQLHAGSFYLSFSSWFENKCVTVTIPDVVTDFTNWLSAKPPASSMVFFLWRRAGAFTAIDSQMNAARTG